MAVTLWEGITSWLSKGGYHPVLWSGVTVLVAAAVYLLLRRMFHSVPGTAAARKSRMRMVGLGLLLVVLLVLVRTWGSWILAAGSAAPGEGTQALLENLLWTCGAGAAVYLLVRAVQRALIPRAVDIGSRHKIRQTTTWIGVFVFVIVGIFIWARQIQNLGVFLGIVGAGMALSLQESLLCIVGWLLLVVRKPFDIGDRVEIDGRVGDVIGISVFQSSLLEVGNWVGGDQSTGRMLMIPNSMIVRHAIYNYSKGFPFIWDEFATTVTFESDWEEASTLMLEKAEVEAERIAGEVARRIKQMQSRYAIHYEQLSPIVYTSIAAHGVDLTLRYLSPVRQRRNLSHRISETILRAFRDHPRIDFAYPTTRFYRNPEEGKPALGRPPEQNA